MRPARLAAGLFLLTTLAFGATPAANAAAPEAVSSAPARTPAGELAGFHLPDGFEAQLVASEPEIHKPLNIAFDDLGRLWVTETLEYPFPAAPGTTPRDGVKILSDFGPDGRARKVATFATGLNIPIGVLPMPGGKSALVHSIPNVYRIDDTGKKEPLYQTYGAKDTHGMTNAFTWGFDGWVYACHGFSNQSTVSGRDQKAITMQSGNVYRMRPDGSHLEYVTHGQVNPFGLAFDPLGNLYSCDCHSRPIYQLLRGAYYPSFAKPDDGLGFGPEMTTNDHGSTAISGLVYYAADHFPEEYRDTVFIGNVVTNRINHDRVEWKGATPKAVLQPDFLVSDDPWFRPVDIELGPDGALYVADFYNRIIGHYEVPLTHPGRDRERGRIWRIVYRGKDKAATVPPMVTFEGKRADQLEDFAEKMGHPNLAVRVMATNRQAGGNRAGHIEFLEKLAGADANPLRRAHALWVLERLHGMTDEFLVKALSDRDRLVRVHAALVAGERFLLEGEAAEAVRARLKDDDPLVRRASAEALGRHPDPANLEPLLALWDGTPADDTHMTHVARIALRNYFLVEGHWHRNDIAELSERHQSLVADVVPAVPLPEAARFLFYQVKDGKELLAKLPRYVRHVARYADDEISGRVLDLVKTLAKRVGDDRRLDQVALLKAYLQGLQERGEAPDRAAKQYAVTLADALLGSAKVEENTAGVALAGSFRLEGTRDRLIALAAGDKGPQPIRIEALVALAAVDPKGAVPVLARVLSDPGKPYALRDRAAGLLAASGEPEARKSLLDALPTAPLRVQSAIAAGLVARKAGAEALLDAVAAGKASARLLQENRVAGPLGNAGIPDLDGRLKSLLRGLPPADKATDALITARRVGFGRSKAEAEAAAGEKVFTTHCASCHQVGGKGSKVGPQLDGAGLRGVDRLLEDVLDPSRNVDQTFRLTSLALKDGRVVSGLLLREEGEILVLADAQGKDVRVDRNDVEERTISPLSPMPANFSEQIPEADFYRLIAYLASLRPADR